MTEVVTFLLLGIGSGGLIAGMGLGVVLSYRGTGVINLAVGSIAMVAGFFFWSVRLGRFATLPTVPAVVLTLAFAAVVGLVFELLVIRPLRTSTPLAKLIAALGVLIALQALAVLVFGPAPRPQPSILPTANVSLFGVLVGEYNFYIGGILLVLAGALIALYRWTRFGIGTRAAAENESHAMLLGLSPNALSLANTLLMSVLMGVVGLLSASITQLDTSTLPLLVVPGLAAAMFGRFTSFGTTAVSGLLIGMAESLLVYLSTQSWFPNSGGVGFAMPGIQQLLTFLILVVATFYRAGKIPSRADVLERHLPTAPRPRSPLRTTAAYVLVAAVALLFLPTNFRSTLIFSLIAAIVLISSVVITGYLGQLSLVQLAVAGTAAFATSRFAHAWGLGFPAAPILGVIAAVVLGVLCGIPALRVRGVSLAVITLAAAVAVQDFGWAGKTLGGAAGGAGVPEPSLFGLDLSANGTIHGFNGAEPSPAFGWFVLVVLGVIVLIVCNLRRSGLGLDMLAVRANERAAAAAGIGVRSTKMVGFAISSAIAGIGGVTLAFLYGSITAGNFDILTGLDLIAFGYIFGITTAVGAIWGGLTFVGGITAFALQQWFGLEGTWFTLLSGLLLIVVLIWQPAGLATTLSYGDRALGRRALTRRRVPPPRTPRPADLAGAGRS